MSATTTIEFSLPPALDTVASEVFGVRKVAADPVRVRALLIKGLEPSAVVRFEEATHLSRVTVARLLGVSDGHLRRKVRERTPLSRAMASRMASVVDVIDRAGDVLGSRDKALQWIAEPSRALGGKSPLEWMQDEVGTREVLRVLGRIEHGVFS